MEHMRARHEVFGVKDIPKTAHYLNNGWTEVAADTPLTVDEQRKAVNDARRGTLNDRPAAEVVAALDILPEEEKAAVVAEEKAGKARKTVLEADKD